MRASARRAVSELRGQILRYAQNDREKQNWIPAFAGMTMGMGAR